MTLKKKIAAALALVLVAGASAGVWMIGGPSIVIGMLRYDQRQEGKLKVGDMAPDVELLSLDGARKEKLTSQFGDKPLVLMFGSFT
jgi:hypothetical protein